MEDTRTHSLDELCALTGTAKRTVRYYIQNGLVDRPDGANKGARYGVRHIGQILRIRRLREAGLSLGRIRRLTGDVPAEASPPPPRAGAVRVLSHVRVAPGVELVIDPAECRLGNDAVRRLVADVLRLADEAAGPSPPAGTDPDSSRPAS